VLAIQLYQDHIHVVRSQSDARKRPAMSNGIPAVDLRFQVICKYRLSNKTGAEQNSHAATRNMGDWNISETGINCFHFIVLTLNVLFNFLLFIVYNLCIWIWMMIISSI
jgi:hypothetical protein